MAQDSRFLDELNVIRNQIEYYQLDEALGRALRLKERYQESLPLRELLFELYLKKRIFNQSAEELTFIEARRNDEKTRYLAARLALAEGKYGVSSEATANIRLSVMIGRELVANNNRFLEPRLLLCESLLLLNQPLAAKRHGDYYKGIRGNDRPWFRCEADILLATTPLPQKKIIELFKTYQEHFERDATFFRLEATFFKRLRDYSRALRSIDQALYLNANAPDTIREKINLLYQLKAYTDLKDFLKSHPGQTREEQALRLYTRALIYFLDNKEPPSTTGVPTPFKAWKLQERAQPKPFLYTPLKTVLTLDTENEPLRFFYEMIVVANTSFTHPLRSELAAYHGAIGAQKLEQGALKAARIHYLRALTLAPQERSLRDEYLNLLKARQSRKAYVEELTIIQTLTGDTELADSYKHHTLLARIEKATRNDIENRYKITRDEHIREGVELLIISPTKNKPAASRSEIETDFFYLQNIFEAMLSTSLETSFYLKPTFIPATELETALSARPYDAILMYDFTQHSQTVSLEYTLTNARTRTTLQANALTASGNERFFKILLKLRDSLEKAIIRRGRILRIDDNKLILSLGKEQILETLAMKPMFYIEKKSFGVPVQLLGPFPIKQIEERVSLGEIRDYFLLKEVKLGESIIMKPLAETFKEK